MICKLKTLKSESGLTLTELLISIAIISVIAGVCVQLVSGSLDAWGHNKGKGELLNSARLAMERMVSKVRSTTWVLLPLKISDPTDPGYPASSYYPRDILAVSGNVDNDSDGLADEDPGGPLTKDEQPGIMMIDDDIDTTVDEGDPADDDEDGEKNEDVIDGFDNDGDGRVDEDPKKNFYASVEDDDGDGTNNEDGFDPVIFYLSGYTLMERHNVLNATVSDDVIAENVAEFRVLRRRVNGNTLIDIYLKLDNGEDSVELSTTALARGMFKP
jgi:prepilin-type N-terminal cleavage/methylation domain-containing protein